MGLKMSLEDKERSESGSGSVIQDNDVSDIKDVKVRMHECETHALDDL